VREKTAEASLGSIVPQSPPAGEFEEAAPDVTKGAKALAQQWIRMAKSET
jgi:hypothetical protein